MTQGRPTLDLYWYLAGVASALSAVAVLLALLRGTPRFGALPGPSLPVATGFVIVLGALLGAWRALAPSPIAGGVVQGNSAAVPASAVSNASPGPTMASPAAGAAPAASMDSAIASLEARLARGGGTPDDWELLAKSFEFLGRAADAAKARAHQLPSLPVDATTLTAALGRGAGAAMPGTGAPGSAALPAPASAPAAAGAPGPAGAPGVPAPVLSQESTQLLARASAARRAKNPQAAAAIYAQLGARGQLDADGWADYADTAAGLQGNKLAGTPETYIARALALDPRHPKALWLQASADEERQRWNDAIAVWQTLSAVLEPDSADARIVAANLAQDRKLAGNAASATAAASSGADAAGPGTVVNGEVTIAPALASRARKGTTLFIFARSVDTPGAPLAVLRTAVDAWPLKFRLDDTLAMVPGRTLSGASRITVEARISQSGQAMPGSGDLAGRSAVLSAAARDPVRIVIDQVQP
jgi:cytochrome c-type biogenesis protein CcmH